jgi:hypothetical protein
MTITFENDSDVIIYALEKIISFARENQYLFVANCVWWIAGVTGLDFGLTRYIDTLYLRQQVGLASDRNSIVQKVSLAPRDIARSVSPDSDFILLEEENLRIRSGKAKQGQKKPKVNTGSGVKKLTKNQRRKLSKQARQLRSNL